MHTEDPRAERRAELLDAADRVIRERGPEASMAAIAAEAGITKPILYRHFGDKSGLWRALAERKLGPLTPRLRTVMAERERGLDKVTAAIDLYLSFIEADPESYRFLMHRALRQDPEGHAVVVGFVHLFAEEVAETLARDLELDDLPASLVTAWGHAIVGAVSMAGDWWLVDGSQSRGELVGQLAVLLWSGLAHVGQGTEERRDLTAQGDNVGADTSA